MFEGLFKKLRGAHQEIQKEVPKRKIPKPDRYIGSVPVERLEEFYALFGDKKAFEENFSLQKFKLWRFLGEIFPELIEETEKLQDPLNPAYKTLHHHFDQDDGRIGNVAVYEKFPGVFIDAPETVVE